MKNFRYSIFVLFALLLSCNKNSVYNHLYQNFPDNRWYETDVKTFEFDLKKSQNCDLVVNFSHIYDFQFEMIPVVLDITYPDQTTKTETVMIYLTDKNGKSVSDCTGDICDMEQIISTDTAFEAGHYKMTLRSLFDHPFIPNVLGLGITLRRPEPSK